MDEKDDLPPNYEIEVKVKQPDQNEEGNGRDTEGGMLSQMGHWLIRVIMEMDGRIDSNGIKLGMSVGKPPKWNFRWDASGRRLPVGVRS
jgi:hypothetical protein